MLKNTQLLVKLSMFSAIAFVLMLLNFPLPFLPDFLKIDFSDVPALLAALLFSPMAGVIVEALKNILYYLFRGSGIPIGELSNFIAGCAFILPVAFFYHKRKTKGALAKGLISGTLLMVTLLAVLNYFLILPAYAWFFGMDFMLDPTVKLSTTLGAIIPFNLIKAAFVSALFIPIFVKLRPWIKQNQLHPETT
ncbi:ECF transporter S component [Jeotgalibacillus sp. R-1-5s-1]|uniref:ECF transporter S component n=1 Tax=Jeotgalibacillus sp. R-1-5s-1 TaxID=2555897 RepID=UPI00106C668C|nr:ECF transporter S component [Jeotgalibacillus sp. R-1-5s-1]TFE00039.1 ECF transporter S component [Jeotgalibacillus sp. R-1-5s-1]